MGSIRSVFLIGLCIGWGDLSAQTVLPDIIVDSMIFEVKKGRECNNLQASQAEVIKAQGEELLANGTLIKLSGNQIQTLESMVVNLKDQNKLQSERFSNKEKENKKKLRKRAVIILGQAVIIVLLILP